MLLSLTQDYMAMKITVYWDVIPISARNLDIQRNLAASIFEAEYDKQEKDNAIIYIYIYVYGKIWQLDVVGDGSSREELDHGLGTAQTKVKEKYRT